MHTETSLKIYVYQMKYRSDGGIPGRNRHVGYNLTGRGPQPLGSNA